MRALSVLAVLSFGCVPAFESVPCYGAGECPAPAVCVHRRCLTLPVDGGVDAEIDATIPDAVEVVGRFGQAGVARFSTLAAHAVTAAVALPDGGLLFGGHGPDGAFIARLNRSGGWVTTFGEGGVLRLPADAMYRLGALHLVDGERIVVVGTAAPPGRSIMVVHRYALADGALDPAFAEGGRWRISDVTYPGADSYGAGITTASGGRLIVSGATHAQVGDGVVWALMVVRLLSDGRLDGAFGEGGIAVQGDPARLPVQPLGLTTTPDGQILVGGMCAFGPICSGRLTVDGRFDAGYGIDGLASAQVESAVLGSETHAIAWSAAGAYVAVRQSVVDGQRVALYRLTPNGALDLGFEAVTWETHNRLGTPRLQPACSGLDLARPVGVIERLDDSARPQPLDGAVAVDAPARVTPFPLGEGEWLYVEQTAGALVLHRVRTTCAQGG